MKKEINYKIYKIFIKGYRVYTSDELDKIDIKISTARCGKCSNNCLLTINRFGDNKRFISGNKCDEPVASVNKSNDLPNLYQYKYDKLFSYKPLDIDKASKGVIGIPRVLNMYENYPFWHTLFTELGFRVELSSESSKKVYEKGLESIVSETACYPAKLVHGHVEDLIQKGVKNIFYPSIIHEIKEQENADNCFNCPVVTSYPEVIKNNMDSIKENNINFMSPFLPFRDKKKLKRRLLEELSKFNLSKKEISKAVDAADIEQEKFKVHIRNKGEETLKYIEENNIKGVLLGGRPYHIDPEINHGMPKLINSLGLAVFTEDSLSHLKSKDVKLNVIDQWAYHSRLYASSKFILDREDIELVQLTSFGCGLDSITVDQVKEILDLSSKIYTNIKIDEGSNLGAAKIRIRSLKAAMKEREQSGNTLVKKEVEKPKSFVNPGKKGTIIVPEFSPVHFEVLQAIFVQNGYNIELLKNSENVINQGLKYLNNDICYPAMVVIGQIIDALKSGKYNLEETTILLAQTEGQCRFTNYVKLLEKALKDAGMGQVPVISLSLAGAKKEYGLQGLNFDMLKKSVAGMIYGDLLTKVLYRVRPYEKIKGESNRLYEKWLKICQESFKTFNKDTYKKVVNGIIKDFESIARIDIEKPKVGVVGESLVKLSPIANNNIVDMLEREGVEVVCNDLLSMLLAPAINNIYNYKNIEGNFLGNIKGKVTIKFIEIYQKIYIEAIRGSKLFYNPERIKDTAKNASKIISLGNQSGEGWKLAGEIIELAHWNVKNIVCMQPFGCLPAHANTRGAIKSLKKEVKGLNIVPIEYDPGSSEVNQLNRIKLMLASAFNKI